MSVNKALIGPRAKQYKHRQNFNLQIIYEKTEKPRNESFRLLGWELSFPLTLPYKSNIGHFMPNDHETILKTEVKLCSWVKLLKIILKTQRNLMFA